MCQTGREEPFPVVGGGVLDAPRKAEECGARDTARTPDNYATATGTRVKVTVGSGFDARRLVDALPAISRLTAAHWITAEEGVKCEFPALRVGNEWVSERKRPGGAFSRSGVAQRTRLKERF